jgi:hypothetical protein
MRWQDVAMQQAQDTILALFVSPSDTLVFDATDEIIPRGSSVPVSTVVLAVAFVDNASSGLPHASHLAASLISLIVARRPASCFSLLDPAPAVQALVKMLQGIFDLVKDPHCLVEECFGTVQVPIATRHFKIQPHNLIAR